VEQPLETAMTTLTSKQITVLAAYGAVLWFLAAMLVRVLAPMGALSGIWQVVTYALVVPGTVPAIWIARGISGLARGQTAIGILVVTGAALLMDGVAFGWFPQIYGADPAHWLAGAAAVFWGAGVGLVLGILMNRD
jgi:hypothetical protein